MSLAVVAVTEGGAQLARRLGAQYEGVEVHLPARLREADGCRYFETPLSEQLPLLFARVDGLVCIMATGIVIRLLAPHLRSKTADPALVVMDEAGRFAVSLLCGHLGGANDLARELAEITGAQAVITTATDSAGLPAWDSEARRQGLIPEPVRNIRVLNRLLLEGAPVALVDREGRIAPQFAHLPFVRRCATFAEALAASVSGRVFVTHRHLPGLEWREDLLVLRPKELVAGIGCKRGTRAEEIEAAVLDVMNSAFLSPESLACVATIDAKKDEEGITAFARARSLPVEYHDALALNGVEAPSAPSPRAMAAVGATGVAEPAALLSAGNCNLLVAKKKRGNVTVAVALRSRASGAEPFFKR